MRPAGKLARVVTELDSRIENAVLVSGQRLVEADLTQEFGISRALLREAFRHLAAEGAIDLVPNRGAEVRRLSKREALELFEIRTELEGIAARRAADRMDIPSVRQAFQAATNPFFVSPRRFGTLEYIAENEAFHRAIFIAADNKMLVDLARKMRLSLIMSQLREALSPAVLAKSLKEHRSITAAIGRGDPVLAEAESRKHLDRAKRFVFEAPDRLFRSPSG
jgi:DNA-binding GntR family transcriptional regulator